MSSASALSEFPRLSTCSSPNESGSACGRGDGDGGISGGSDVGGKLTTGNESEESS